MSGAKKAAAVCVILFGCFWPFAMHGIAMHRLFWKLSQDPRYWLAYEVFLTILPSPALIYAGFLMFLKEQVPYPAYLKLAAAGSALVFLASSLVYLLVVGGVGFKIPI